MPLTVEICVRGILSTLADVLINRLPLTETIFKYCNGE